MAATVEKKKRDSRTTAAGIAVYPRVSGEPDTQFDAEGTFSTKIRFEATNEKGAAYAAELKAEIDTRMKQTLAAAKKEYPAKVAEAKAKKAKPPKAPELASTPYFEDEETGDITFTFKMRASGVSKKTNKPWTAKPRLFDAKGTPIVTDIKLGGGSEIKVNFEPSDFYKPLVGAGVSLRLNAVQVIKLVEWAGGDAKSYGFTEEEGFESDAVSSDVARGVAAWVGEAAEEGFENEEAPATPGSEADEF